MKDPVLRGQVVRPAPMLYKCRSCNIMGLFDYFKTPEGLQEYDPDEFEKKMKEGTHTVIDVRTPREFKHGHIEGVQLKPLGKLKRNLDEFDKNSSYLLVCATGHRSRAAAAAMKRKGFKNVGHLKGGMMAWKSRKGGSGK